MSPRQILTEALERLQREHGVRVITMSVEWMSTATVAAPEDAIVQSVAVNAIVTAPVEGRNANH